jgi:hypothetical protein
LLIASALLAAAAKHYDDDDKNVLGGMTACKLLDFYNQDAECGHLVAGTVRCSRARGIGLGGGAIEGKPFLGGVPPLPATCPP